MPYCAKFRQNRLFYCGDSDFFQFFKMAVVRNLGSVYAYLVHPLTVQNLVVIDAVVSIIWKFQYLARFAWKRLFTPQNWSFWTILFPKWVKYQRNPTISHPAWVRVVWAIKRENLPTGRICRWVNSPKYLLLGVNAFSSQMCQIFKLSYYQNCCIDHNQILHSD